MLNILFILEAVWPVEFFFFTLKRCVIKLIFQYVQILYIRFINETLGCEKNFNSWLHNEYSEGDVLYSQCIFVNSHA
jgi:hypothetical protein